MGASQKKIFIENFNKTLFMKNKKITDWENKNCIRSYCNKKCKNTMFEEGTEIPEEVFKNMKEHLTNTLKNPKIVNDAYKQSIKIFNEMRHTLFGNKTNVLKNDFYEKLPQKTVKKLKGYGAISGCSSDHE